MIEKKAFSQSMGDITEIIFSHVFVIFSWCNSIMKIKVDFIFELFSKANDK